MKEVRNSEQTNINSRGDIDKDKLKLWLHIRKYI